MSSLNTPKLKIYNDAEFMRELKRKVQISLGEKPGKDNFHIYTKGFIVLLWMALSFSGILYFESTYLKLISCFLYAGSCAGLGFNLFHDSNHGSLSSSKKVNYFFSIFSASLLGASHFLWKHKHNYLHHQFPNIQNWDDDLETREGLRLGPKQPWKSKFKLQYIYAPFIYALTTMEWFFVKDFIQYFSGRLNKWHRVPTMKFKDHVEFWLEKVIYYSLTVFLPLQFFNFSEYIVGFVFVHLSFSVIIASIFQLAHVTETSIYPEPKKGTNQIELGWAELQLRTTTNFAPNNKFITWFVGGLNFQVEHHLLPNISHTYYPQISPIVKEVCHNFGYPYYCIPTYFGALKNHLLSLKTFAKKPTQHKYERNELSLSQP